jgi:hypothetical protein
MATGQVRPHSIDEYIAAFSPEVQAILERIRLAIAKAAPEAQESISYRIPTFTLSGALVYFAAFKKHIGFYPPVRGDAGLEKGGCSLRRRDGQSEISTRSADPIRLDRKNCETQSETEPGEGHCKEQEGAVKERRPAWGPRAAAIVKGESNVRSPWNRRQ